MSKIISEILSVIPSSTLINSSDVQILEITHDSREVESGYLFCCVNGSNADGHDFAANAVKSGAVALLVERELELDIPQIIVPNVRTSLGLVSAIVYGHPSNELTIFGVTGTNGKSSVVQMMHDIWTTQGTKSEIFGTLKGSRTTPEAPHLQKNLRSCVDRGIQAVAMEVSSHALELGRVSGTRFKLVMFTNLSHDHLDFHGSMNKYFEAKAKLFSPEFSSVAVVNSDDPYSSKLTNLVEKTETYAISDAKNLVMEGPKSTFNWRGRIVELSLAGSYNVSNAVGAATSALLLGISEENIVKALSKTKPVSGRFEIISDNHPFTVAVDYAHTPDALVAVLKAARESSSSNRVVVVFGCGGDRDSKKRPEMGNVAEEFSDIAILTTDNPRSEDASLIAADVMQGVTDPGSILQIPDRRAAISSAISNAKAGDVVVIAGKGHEEGQIVGSTVYPFNDVTVAKEILGAD